MQRQSGISLTFLVLYLVFFAHASIPHVHESHDSFGPVCCGLLNQDCDDESHHHIPTHSESQYDSICISPATLAGVFPPMPLEAVVQPPVDVLTLFLPQTGRIEYGSDPPPLLEGPVLSPGALRAPPAA